LSSIIRSYAKINLFLDVTGRDSADGYHYIESIFQEIDLFDEIAWEKSSEDSVSFSGANVGGDSTVHRALELFKTDFGVKFMCVSAKGFQWARDWVVAAQTRPLC